MVLHQKTAIITGASSGIGAFFSRALVQKGARVYGLARREEALQTIQKELGDRFIPVVMDITHRQDVADWVLNTFSQDHLPDILVNNAGLGYFGDIDTLSGEQWDTMMQVNLTGVYNITHVVVPLLKKNPAVTHIVHIASVAGLIGNPQISGYNATKFGLRGFSEALMKELRPYGIKVTCMFPGSIATEFFNGTSTQVHPNMMQPGDVARVLVNVLEMPDNFLIDEVTMRPLNPKPPAG